MVSNQHRASPVTSQVCFKTCDALLMKALTFFSFPFYQWALLLPEDNSRTGKLLKLLVRLLHRVRLFRFSHIHFISFTLFQTSFIFHYNSLPEQPGFLFPTKSINRFLLFLFSAVKVKNNLYVLLLISCSKVFLFV
jgi:hypothetical protein